VKQGGTINSQGQCIPNTQATAQLNQTQCESIGGTFNPNATPPTPTCTLPTGNMNPTTCADLGGDWIPATNRCDLATAKCEMERQMFFQTLVENAQRRICNTNYRIVRKISYFTISGIVPGGSNVIPNSHLLHLLGGGGGGGCGTSNNDGEGGGAGEVKVIPLRGIANGGESFKVKIGSGGVGAEWVMNLGFGSCEKNATPGLPTFVEFQAGLKATFMARGGFEGKKNGLQTCDNLNCKGFFGTTASGTTNFAVGESVMFAGVQYSGGQRNQPGQSGAGGGGGYDTNNNATKDGKNGGNGVVAITWFEWEIVP
jgi:hypothetical protein